MVNSLHKLNLEIQSVDCDSNTLVTSIPNLNSVKSFVTSKNVTQLSNYNAVLRLAQEISNKTKCLNQPEFEHVLSQLSQINEFLANKTSFKVVSIDSDSDNDVTLTLGNQAKGDGQINQDKFIDEDIIISSRSSTASVDSYFISNKKIISRKRDMGQLSMYSTTNSNCSKYYNSKSHHC